MPSLVAWAQPRNILRISGRLTPPLACITALMLGLGAVLAFAAPADYQQGLSVRIMYVHVPSAWLGIACYFLLASAAACGLVFRFTAAFALLHASIVPGASFTLIALLTGSLWGKTSWGTWWVWDARLTSMLVLLFLYLGVGLMLRAFENPKRGARAAALLALIGALDLPVIKFSVDWWNTLHQPASLLRRQGPSIHPSLLWPLATMGLALTALCALCILWRWQASLLTQQTQALNLRAQAAPFHSHQENPPR